MKSDLVIDNSALIEFFTAARRIGPYGSEFSRRLQARLNCWMRKRSTACEECRESTPEPRHGRSGPSFADASPAEVRAALIPEEAAEFDQQWREAMTRATEALDLSEVLETLESWRRVARLTAARGAEAHWAMYRRAAGRLIREDIPADEPLPQTKARLGR